MVANIEVSNQHANEFFGLLENTVKGITKTQREELRLFVMYRNAIAISFDKQWKPFLGYTAGYNPKEERTPLEWVWLLQKVKLHLMLMKDPIPGGRVFLRSSGATRSPEYNEIKLCTFDWKGQDLIVGTLKILYQLRQV